MLPSSSGLRFCFLPEENSSCGRYGAFPEGIVCDLNEMLLQG
jgi:hypothetical protein